MSFRLSLPLCLDPSLQLIGRLIEAVHLGEHSPPPVVCFFPCGEIVASWFPARETPSRTLDKAEWVNTRLISDTEDVRALDSSPART
jgi:hypothetical protein